MPGAIEVYEGSCVGSVITNKLVSTIKNTTGSDEEDEMMAQSRNSRNDGACLHVTREINLGPGIPTNFKTWNFDLPKALMPN